jgi:hypothetical protein
MQNGSDGRDRGLSAFESFAKSTVPAELESTKNSSQGGYAAAK